jgi:NAD-dependent dihydropyrimidine dehydrogenase PreA subunit
VRYLSGVATLKLDREKCTGCGRCVEVCPRRVLVLREKRAEIESRDDCIECGACECNCAFGAVTVRSGVGCAQALFTAMLTGGEPVCGCGGEGTTSGGCC